MFAQVIRAKVLDAQAVESQFRRCESEVAAGMSGWHDMTGGVTGEGVLVSVTRFESAEQARRHFGRQELTPGGRRPALF